jgi:hypothetical protein
MLATKFACLVRLVQMVILTDADGRLTYCGFVARVLPWSVHSPSARGDAAQGITYLYTSLDPNTNIVDCAGRPARQR